MSLCIPLLFPSLPSLLSLDFLMDLLFLSDREQWMQLLLLHLISSTNWYHVRRQEKRKTTTDASSWTITASLPGPQIILSWSEHMSLEGDFMPIIIMMSNNRRFSITMKKKMTTRTMLQMPASCQMRHQQILESEDLPKVLRDPMRPGLLMLPVSLDPSRSTIMTQLKMRMTMTTKMMKNRSQLKSRMWVTVIRSLFWQLLLPQVAQNLTCLLHQLQRMTNNRPMFLQQFLETGVGILPGLRVEWLTCTNKSNKGHQESGQN